MHYDAFLIAHAWLDIYCRSRVQIFRKLQSWFEHGRIKTDGDWLRFESDSWLSKETWVVYMQSC